MKRRVSGYAAIHPHYGTNHALISVRDKLQLPPVRILLALALASDFGPLDLARTSLAPAAAVVNLFTRHLLHTFRASVKALCTRRRCRLFSNNRIQP